MRDPNLILGAKATSRHVACHTSSSAQKSRAALFLFSVSAVRLFGRCFPSDLSSKVKVKRTSSIKHNQVLLRTRD